MKKFLAVLLLILFLLSAANAFKNNDSNNKVLNKYIVQSKFVVGKDFLGCKKFKEFSKYPVPNFFIKVSKKGFNEKIFEARFGKVLSKGVACTLFFERKSKYCELYCVTSTKALVENPPIPYPIRLPETLIQKIISKNSLNPNWSEKTPFLDVRPFSSR